MCLADSSGPFGVSAADVVEERSGRLRGWVGTGCWVGQSVEVSVYGLGRRWDGEGGRGGRLGRGGDWRGDVEGLEGGVVDMVSGIKMGYGEDAASLSGTHGWSC